MANLLLVYKGFSFVTTVLFGILRDTNGLQKSSQYIRPSYKNFHPNFDDIKNEAHEKSQIIGEELRWTSPGLVVLYPHGAYSVREECVLNVAIETLRTYSCLPIHIFKIRKDCSSSPSPLNCILKWKNDPIVGKETIKQMSDAGIYPETLVNYVVINADPLACSSAVGKRGGKQTMELSYVCLIHQGSPIHELTHALGYHHEQTRIDRDRFIAILKDNIEESSKYNFDKQSNNAYSDFGPYDFRSTMHYPLTAFAKRYPPGLKSMEIQKGVNPGVDPSSIGQTWELTIGDKARIRAVTGCFGSTFEDHASEARRVDNDDPYFQSPPPPFKPDSTFLRFIENRECGFNAEDP